MEANLLTVGVPTYNRRDAVVEQLQAWPGAVGVELLVVDDGSTDGTFEAVAAVDGVRVLRNEQNLGYARALVRILSEASTPYVVLQSDDDRLVPQGFPALLELLRQAQPPMVVTPWRRGGRFLRSVPRRGGEVTEAQLFRAATHMPGLVLRAPAPGLDVLGQRIEDGCAAANLYPQVLLAAFAIAQGGARFLSAEVSTGGVDLPTQLRHEGAGYTTLPSRWRQLLAFDDFFSEQTPEGAWRRMREANQRRAFDLLRSGLAHDQPDWLPAFDEQAGRLRGQRTRLRVHRLLRRAGLR